MTEVLRYYSAFPTQVTDESHSRLQQYVLAEDFDRVTAERDKLQRDKTVTDQRVEDLQKLLRNLLKDCMASDFNEHWESFSDAEAYISDLETNKHE